MLALASLAVVRVLCYSALVLHILVSWSSTGRAGMDTQVGLHSGLFLVDRGDWCQFVADLQQDITIMSNLDHLFWCTR
jgi:hypothetical protein